MLSNSKLLAIIDIFRTLRLWMQDEAWRRNQHYHEAANLLLTIVWEILDETIPASEKEPAVLYELRQSRNTIAHARLSLQTTEEDSMSFTTFLHSSMENTLRYVLTLPLPQDTASDIKAEFGDFLQNESKWSATRFHRPIPVDNAFPPTNETFFLLLKENLDPIRALLAKEALEPLEICSLFSKVSRLGNFIKDNAPILDDLLKTNPIKKVLRSSAKILRDRLNHLARDLLHQAINKEDFLKKQYVARKDAIKTLLSNVDQLLQACSPATEAASSESTLPVEETAEIRVMREMQEDFQHILTGVVLDDCGLSPSQFRFWAIMQLLERTDKTNDPQTILRYLEKFSALPDYSPTKDDFFIFIIFASQHPTFSPEFFKKIALGLFGKAFLGNALKNFFIDTISRHAVRCPHNLIKLTLTWLEESKIDVLDLRKGQSTFDEGKTRLIEDHFLMQIILQGNFNAFIKLMEYDLFKKVIVELLTEYNEHPLCSLFVYCVLYIRKGSSLDGGQAPVLFFTGSAALLECLLTLPEFQKKIQMPSENLQGPLYLEILSDDLLDPGAPQKLLEDQLSKIALLANVLPTAVFSDPKLGSLLTDFVTSFILQMNVVEADERTNCIRTLKLLSLLISLLSKPCERDNHLLRCIDESNALSAYTMGSMTITGLESFITTPKAKASFARINQGRISREVSLIMLKIDDIRVHSHKEIKALVKFKWVSMRNSLC